MSENLKAFTIYTVQTENDVYGAPQSDKKPAQTGSSYQCSVSIYITTVQSSS